MTTPTPTYELSGDNDLSKFLLGTIRDVRKAELDVEKAQAISQLADKYIKLEVAKCLKAKITGRLDDLLNVDAEISRALIQNINGIE